MAKSKGSFYVDEEKLSFLVDGLKQNDPVALDEFRRTFEGYVGRYIHTKVGNDCDIEELVQDTLDAACANIEKQKTPAALVSWVRTIARRKIYHYYDNIERRKKREEKEEERERKRKLKCGIYVDLDDPTVQKIINSLSDQQKETIVLRVKGLKVREIAAVMNVPEGTVKSRLNYARKTIAKNMPDEHFKKSRPKVGGE